MSTNHNRIKVADLETNQPNKILKTNLNGELEFSDLSNLQAENYNALDCTTEGKALDARQGKVLKDMIDNKNINLSTDQETQITTAVTEDNKVVSRSKLFNWWQWIKSQTQTISGAWNFSNKVTLTSGTKDTPPLIIPNGDLTSNLQNGSIERDSNGQIWETHSGIRSRLISTSDNLILLAYKFLNTLEVYLQTSMSETKQYVSSSSAIGKIANKSVQRLNATTLTNCTFWNSNPNKPTTCKIEVFLRINNGLFATHWSGLGAVNQVKIMEYSGFDIYGYKNYQDLLLFDIQNSDISKAQWSTIVFPEKTFIDGDVKSTDRSYYLRDALNTRTLGASEASFSFVFVNTLDFEDATNVNGLNTMVLLRTNNYALFIETII